MVNDLCRKRQSIFSLMHRNGLGYRAISTLRRINSCSKNRLGLAFHERFKFSELGDDSAAPATEAIEGCFRHGRYGIVPPAEMPLSRGSACYIIPREWRP